MVKEIWSATNIRLSLINRIKRILETKAAEMEGLNNVNQFVDSAVRDLLNKLEEYEKTEEVKTMQKEIKMLQEKVKKAESSEYDYPKQQVFTEDSKTATDDPYYSKLRKSRMREH